jgi:DNA replication protein DnaC
MAKIFDELFSQGVASLQNHGFNPYPQRLRIRIPQAKEQLAAGLRYYLGSKAEWLPCYEEVVTWLSDNKGRGLLCVGDNGLGKTLICQNIIPVILQQNMRRIVKTYSALDMNLKLDELLRCNLINIDDVGTEQLETISYGVRRIAFSELVDASEKQGTLLILSTNLRTNHGTDREGNTIPSIEDRYGLRTYDRLKAVVKSVKFKGESMRR